MIDRYARPARLRSRRRAPGAGGCDADCGTGDGDEGGDGEDGRGKAVVKLAAGSAPGCPRAPALASAAMRRDGRGRDSGVACLELDELVGNSRRRFLSRMGDRRCERVRACWRAHLPLPHRRRAAAADDDGGMAPPPPSATRSACAGAGAVAATVLARRTGPTAPGQRWRCARAGGWARAHFDVAAGGSSTALGGSPTPGDRKRCACSVELLGRSRRRARRTSADDARRTSPVPPAPAVAVAAAVPGAGREGTAAAAHPCLPARASLVAVAPARVAPRRRRLVSSMAAAPSAHRVRVIAPPPSRPPLASVRRRRVRRSPGRRRHGRLRRSRRRLRRRRRRRLQQPEAAAASHWRRLRHAQ